MVLNTYELDFFFRDGSRDLFVPLLWFGILEGLFVLADGLFFWDGSRISLFLCFLRDCIVV